MGMFDELRCEYPLPDGWEYTGYFQTKDTPDQRLSRYVLRADGTLIEEATGAGVDFHGTLEFYTDNIAGSGPQGYYTNDDLDGWRANYCALFAYGQLLTLTGTHRPYLAHEPGTPWPCLAHERRISRQEFGAVWVATRPPSA